MVKKQPRKKARRKHPGIFQGKNSSKSRPKKTVPTHSTHRKRWSFPVFSGKSAALWQQLRLDLQVFIKLFPWRVGSALFVGIALTALIFRHLYNIYQSPNFSYIKSVYAILNMLTFQISFADMPSESAMDIFFVIVPLIGIPLLLIFGANILNILRVFFVRTERGQRWQIAHAATIKTPIVVCGVEDRIGYRVASQILDLRRPVIGIEPKPAALVNTLLDRDMPIIFGDIRNEEVLRNAGIQRAHNVLICTRDDLTNIEAAFHIQELNPKANIVLRLFEDEIIPQIQLNFGIKSVVSRSAIAAQAFAQAALGVEVLETFTLESQDYFLAKIPINNGSFTTTLAGQSIATLSQKWDFTVICLYRDKKMIIEPDPQIVLKKKDVIFIFTATEQLAALSECTSIKSDSPAQQAPIIVCGLGHTGYRVARALIDLNRAVVALDFRAKRLSKRLQDEGQSVTYNDFRQASVLEAAGIKTAAALVICAEDDMINFETSLRARELNPDIRVIMRIFEESLGERLQKAFNIDAAYSTSAIAAPIFVSAALKIHLAQPVEVGNEKLFIARLIVEPLSGLYRESIHTLNQEDGLTVLLHKTASGIKIPPEQNKKVTPGDEIVFLASQEKLQKLSLRNQPIRDLP